jgi:photosystem II stability/assembly factor-like uncharacterized protein
VAIVLASALTVSHATAPAPIGDRMLSGLVWRNIGPFRGGRVSAVAGAMGQPGVFYIGYPFGGVWKTTSAGTTWYPVFDAVKEVASIGSIAVAPSNPDVVYAGTGDVYRNSYRGTGIYKSTDAGQTWLHIGLDQTAQLPAIVVDPKDPDIVTVAALGNIQARSDDRGVFRTTDGGRTWQRTLFIDNETGAWDLESAFDAPNVLLATVVHYYNGPAADLPANTKPSGPSSGAFVYKSTDGGGTWQPLIGGGLPASGRFRAAVANNTNGQRMYLDGAGFYRSDDGGATWRQPTGDRRVGNERVIVDTKNPDVVYDMNTSMYRSLDGGATWASFKGAPGGDDPHEMWIDPADHQRMLLGGDQGAAVSFDAGKAWSSWYNQPTAQLYHISADNSFPYWVYGQQQDSGAVAARSRGDFGEIGPFDWFPTPGYETGYIVADPLNPKIIYANGPDSASQFVKIMYPSGQWIHVGPNLDPKEQLGAPGPIVFSPFDPHEMLVGYSRLMSSSDGGRRWTSLSPDLGDPSQRRNPKSATALRRGVISALAASTVSTGVMWAGLSNGLISLTRNHGALWEDVSMAELPGTFANIVSIDASHQRADEAYVAVQANVNRPLIYRTRDFGRTWQPIVSGLPTDHASGDFANCIRADTRQAGLLFASTDTTIYASFDDGDSWQSLRLNLPTTSVRDIQIHGNDLIIGTFGRSMWVLDDYSPLRQMTAATASEAVHLFRPGTATRLRVNLNGDTPFPPEVPHARNPPAGAIVYYSLASKPAGPISLDVLDARGRVVRHLTSDAPPAGPPPPRNVPDFWLAPPSSLPADIGLNRVNWDTRYDPPPSAGGEHVTIRAVPYETPTTYLGPLALPGLYWIQLTVDGKLYRQAVRVRNDPRSPATEEDLRAQHALQMRMYNGVKEAMDANGQIAALRAALAPLIREGGEIGTAASGVDAKLAGLNRGGGGGRGGGPAAQVAAGVASIGFSSIAGSLNHLLEELDSADVAPTPTMDSAYQGTCEDLKTAVTMWRAIVSRDLAALNALLARNHRPLIPAPSPALAIPVCAGQ